MITASGRPQSARRVLQRRMMFHPTTPSVTSEVCEELAYPTIFDIFDAPVRLGESPSRSPLNYSPQRSLTSHSPPTSLPSPITFDGPARPRYTSVSSHNSRHRVQPISNRSCLASIPSSSNAAPLIEIFDGPSRIRTHTFHPLGSTKVAFFSHSADYFFQLMCVGLVETNSDKSRVPILCFWCNWLCCIPLPAQGNG